MDSFSRRLAILRFIAEARTPCSTGAVAAHLTAQGYLNEQDSESTRLRSVQRDLKTLLGDRIDGEVENEFGLQQVSGAGRSQHWYIDPEWMQKLDFNKLPRTVAVALLTLEKHLGGLLPRDSVADLAPLFAQALTRLLQSDRKVVQRHYRRLPQALEFFQRGLPLAPPTFSAKVLDALYQGIAHHQQVEFSYKGQRYQVSCAGIAFLLPKAYLVALRQDAQFRHFLLHRIEAPSLVKQASVVPETFSLRTYLLQGGMGLPLPGVATDVMTITLRLQATHPGTEVPQGLLEDLEAHPPGTHAQLEHLANGQYRFSFQSRLTIQLKNWLLTLGPWVTVENPEPLRAAIRVELTAMLSQYDAVY